jgi:hypothetical protein
MKTAFPCGIRRDRPQYCDMPKKITKELDALVEIVAHNPQGVSPQKIAESLDSPIPERTLQSRLAKLRQSDRLISTGKGPSTLYFLPPAGETPLAPGTATEVATPSIPLSTEARRVKSAVMDPVHTRTPVGYDRAFLDDYIPNKTHYLAIETRQQLLRDGSVMAEDQPAGTYLRKICDRLIVDLAWNSSRLEGNTYSLLETEVLLERGTSAEGKEAQETQMILNHKAAVELLCDQTPEIGFNRYTISNLHAILSDNLLPDPAASGRPRTKSVGIQGSVFVPLDVPQLIEECLDVILAKASQIDDPFEQAFFTMVHLPYLQPFEDVNKRVSRFAANIPFLKRNLCPLSFVDVPEADYTRGTLGVYELKSIDYLREVFVWAYNRSCARYSAITQSLGEPDPLKLKHREIIQDTVRRVVLGSFAKQDAVKIIKESLPSDLSQGTSARLLEIIEVELSGLHESNMARYRITPSQFDKWRSIWDR